MKVLIRSPSAGARLARKSNARNCLDERGLSGTLITNDSDLGKVNVDLHAMNNFC